MKKAIDRMDILDYEVRAHWLASYVSNVFIQDLMGRYFANKVKRKYKRYLYSIDSSNKINETK